MENPEIYSPETVELSKTAWYVLKASSLMSIWRIQKFQSEIQITRKFSGMMFVFVKTKLHTWHESRQGHSWDLMHFTVKGRGSFKIMLSKKQGSNAEKEIGNINCLACQNFRSCKSCKEWAVVSKKRMTRKIENFSQGSGRKLGKGRYKRWWGHSHPLPCQDVGRINI